MKTISIKQPWAWLIVNGYKDMENRSHNWNCLKGQTILLHASKQFDMQGYLYVKRNVSYIHMPEKGEFEQGGIVGKAMVSDVTRERKSKWHQHNQSGIYLKDVQQLPFFPCKGMLGIFEVDYGK
jgi:hypothetical protein